MNSKKQHSINQLRAAGKVRQGQLDAVAFGKAGQELLDSIAVSAGTERYDEHSRAMPQSQRLGKFSISHNVIASSLAVLLLIGVVVGVTLSGDRTNNSSTRVVDRVVVVEAKFGAVFQSKFPSRSVVRGRIEWAVVPRRVALLSIAGKGVGYVDKSYLNQSITHSLGGTQRAPASCGNARMPVFNTKRILVGHLSNGGFAPLGTVSSLCIGVTSTIKSSSGGAMPICAGSSLSINARNLHLTARRANSEVVLTNTEKMSCRIGGIPGIAWTNYEGIPISSIVENARVEYKQLQMAKEIEIGPGASVSFGVHSLGCSTSVAVGKGIRGSRIVLTLPGTGDVPTLAQVLPKMICAIQRLNIFPLEAKPSTTRK